MARLQKVCRLGMMPLFARMGSSACGDRDDTTVSRNPPGLAGIFSAEAYGWLEISGAQLCSEASQILL